MMKTREYRISIAREVMQLLRYRVALLYCAGVLFAVGPAKAVDKDAATNKSQGLTLLAEYLVGSFSSEDQAKADTQFFDIRLEIVPIWNERKDAIWLYVEQASASSLSKPYRQRVYRLTEQREGQFLSDVYTLPEPEKFAGGFKDSSRFAQLAPDQLTLRTGCGVSLRKVNDTLFTGQTTGTGCSSELRGASYATSEVSLSPSGMVSWDRGYDASGKQVWGAKTSGYSFKRVSRK